MSGPGPQEVLGALPRPGRALRGVLLALFSLWLAFAVALNWGGASPDLFALFCGNIPRILSGEVWRLFTAPLMHDPGGYGSILLTLLGLYFLSPSLESAWGPKRFLRFLCFSALLAYGLQLVLALLLPASVSHKLVPNPELWFGAFPVVEAIAIAWALSFKGKTVRLMMLVPVSSKTLVVFVVGTSLLAVVAPRDAPFSGLIAPFGGMLSGWLLGGGTPSPLRRWWLRQRMAQAERELARQKLVRRERVHRSGFRVIEGGQDDNDDLFDDSTPPRSSTSKPTDRRGPDGRLLN